MSLIICPECGKEVSSTAQTCPNCGYGVKKHYSIIESKRLAQIRKAKFKKMLPYIILSVVVASIVITTIAILSQRKLFKNKDDMMEYLTSYSYWETEDSTLGYSIWSSNNSANKKQLCFYEPDFGESISKDWSWGELMKMSPWLGTFNIGFNKYTITNDGHIVDKYDSYEGQYFSGSFEDPVSCLKIEPVSSTIDENGKLEIELQVTNTGEKSYQNIHLHTTVTGENGESLLLDDFEIVRNSENDSFELKSGEVGLCKINYMIPFKAEGCSSTIVRFDSLMF